MHVYCMLARPLASETPPLFKLSSPLDFEIGATLSLPPSAFLIAATKKCSSPSLPPPSLVTHPSPFSHSSFNPIPTAAAVAASAAPTLIERERRGEGEDCRGIVIVIPKGQQPRPAIARQAAHWMRRERLKFHKLGEPIGGGGTAALSTCRRSSSFLSLPRLALSFSPPPGAD